MSDVSSTQPTTEGPCSPIFGTATFSTLTATALTTMFAGSSSRSESSSTCGEQDSPSDSQTYCEEDVSEIDDVSDEDDSRTQRSSPVDDTLSETSSSFIYPHMRGGSSPSEEHSALSSNPSRPASQAWFWTERNVDIESYSTRSGSMSGSLSRRSAGELIAMFEGRAASSRSSTPFPAESLRSASPAKSAVSSGPQVPGGLPAIFRRTGPPWASTSEYTYTYSSRPSSPTKSGVSVTNSSWSFSTSNSASYDVSRSDTLSQSRTSNEYSSRPGDTRGRPSQEHRSGTERTGGANESNSQSLGRTIPPPLDLSEYGCSGRPIRAGYIWYLNAHRLGPYRWQRAEVYLYSQVVVLSWIPPDQGRIVVRLDLLSCLEIRTAPPVPYIDEETGQGEQGGERVSARFDLVYDDSIERLGLELQEDMLDWFQTIQSVFHGTITVDEYLDYPESLPAIAPGEVSDHESSSAQRTAASTSSPADISLSPSYSQSYNSSFTTLTPTYTSTSGRTLTTAQGSDQVMLDIVSGSGTDVVASTLSYRNPSENSLLGDSHSGSDCSYMTPASTGEYDSYSNSRSSRASGDGNNGPELWDHTPRVSGGSSSVGGSSSPASEYATATSPSTSYVSLPDISSFPDDEDSEGTPPRGLTSIPAVPSVVSLHSLDTDGAAAELPDSISIETPAESGPAPEDEPVDEPTEQGVPQQPKYNDQCVETEQPETKSEPEVSREPDFPSEDTPQVEPTQEPLPEEIRAEEESFQKPQPEDAASAVAEEATGLEETIPDAAEEPAPQSPKSDALSALSLAMPSLPPGTVHSSPEEDATLSSPSERSATPRGSVAQPEMSQTEPNDHEDIEQPSDMPSPSVTESVWGAETDVSYDSSILNPSPSSCSQFLPEMRVAPDMLSRIPSIPSIATTVSESLLTPVQDTVSAAMESPAYALVAHGPSPLHMMSTAITEERACPSRASSVSSMSSSTFGGSSVNGSDVTEMAENMSLSEGHVISPQGTADSSSRTSTPPLDVAALDVPDPRSSAPPQLKNISIQCETEDGIASRLFGRLLTEEADRVILQLHTMEQLRTQDKLEVKSMLIELLDLARSGRHNAWDGRLDRSVGGSAISSPARSVLNMDRAIGTSVIPSPARSVLQMDCAVETSVISSWSPVRKRDVAVDRSVGGSIISSPSLSVREDLILSSLGKAQPDVDSLRPAEADPLPALSASQPEAILLTPPPQRPISTGTATDSMSVLSSHYSDDLELHREAAYLPPEVEPVSPSWSGTGSVGRSAISSSLSSDTDELATVPSPTLRLLASRTPLPTHTADAQPLPDMASNGPVEVPKTIDREEVKSSSAKISEPPAQTPKSICVPVPVRAGEPFSGQLARMMREGSPTSQAALAIKAPPSLLQYNAGDPVQSHSPEHSVERNAELINSFNAVPVKLRSDSAPRMHTPIYCNVDIEPANADSSRSSGSIIGPSDLSRDMRASIPLADSAPVPIFQSLDVSKLLMENRKLLEDNVRIQEESRRVYEEHRLAQEDMKGSLAQMKEMLVGFMSRPPVSVHTAMPQYQHFPSPLGFVPQTTQLHLSHDVGPGMPQPSHYCTAYPQASSTYQQPYLLPQMTSNSLPPPPFMHIGGPNEEEPVIPPRPPSASSVISSNTHSFQAKGRSCKVPAFTPSCSSSVSPSVVDRDTGDFMNGYAEMHALASPAQIPLPISTVSMDTQLPTVVTREVDFPFVSATIQSASHIPLPISTVSMDAQLPSVTTPRQVDPIEEIPPVPGTVRSVSQLPLSTSTVGPDTPLPMIATPRQVDSMVEMSSAVPAVRPVADTPLSATQFPLPESTLSVRVPLPTAPTVHPVSAESEASLTGSTKSAVLPSVEAPEDPQGCILVEHCPSHSLEPEIEEHTPVVRSLPSPSGLADTADLPEALQGTPNVESENTLPPMTSVLFGNVSPRSMSSRPHTPGSTEQPQMHVPGDPVTIVPPSCSSARTSPVSAVHTVVDDSPHHSVLRDRSPIISPRPSVRSFHASPIQLLSQDVSASPKTVFADSPTFAFEAIATPVAPVDQALNPVVEVMNTPVESGHERTIVLADPPVPRTPPEIDHGTLILQEDHAPADAQSTDVDLRRSSWNDTASQFRLLVESTQTTAQEALEVLRKTQSLLDDAQKVHVATPTDAGTALLDVGPLPEPSGGPDEITLLREDVASLKQCLAESKESSDSQLTSVLGKLIELQGLHEREAERRIACELEQAADHERTLADLISEKEGRISGLEAEITKLSEDNATLRSDHEESLSRLKEDTEEREAAQAREREELVGNLQKEIEALQTELTTVREQRAHDQQLQVSLDAELEEVQAEHDRLVAQSALEKEQLISERDACIEELRRTLDAKTLELQEAVEREAEAAAREATQVEVAAQHLETIETLKQAQATAETEYTLAKEDWVRQTSELEAAQLEKERLAAEREEELQHKLETLQQELDVTTANLEKEIQGRLAEIAELQSAHTASEKAGAEAALERERAFSEKYELAVKEFKEELVALRIAYEQAIQLQKSEAMEQREEDRVEARERAEQHITQLSELRDKLLSMEECSEDHWTQQFAKHSDVSAQLDKMEESAAEERRKAEEHRLQLEEERAEAASKPSVQSVVEDHLREFSTQIQEQFENSGNSLRADVSRQHEEALGSLTSTVQEQSANALSSCLEEVNRQLNSMGERQHADLLDAMKVTVEEQIAVHIGYYLRELGTLMDSQHAQQLSEVLETVRSTMQEQVLYNVELYLDDLCRRLVPEISQLLKEVREKAEEKYKLDRQIDCLRDIKREHEPGGRLFEGETSSAANHPGLKELNKKAWRKHKAKSADVKSTTEPDIQHPAFEPPKQPLATYPVEVRDSWDSWSENTVNQPPAPSNQVALYGNPMGMPVNMHTPIVMTPQSQSPYHGM